VLACFFLLQDLIGNFSLFRTHGLSPRQLGSRAALVDGWQGKGGMKACPEKFMEVGLFRAGQAAIFL
jgi:hypothetical protein